MAQYSVWARTRRTPRVAWVCGPSAVLRYDVTDAYRAALPLLPVRGVPGTDGVWDHLLTVPPFPLLTFVWGAEQLTGRDRIRHLLEDEFDGAFTVLVAAEKDFPAEQPPWLKALRDSKHGLLVRCSVPRDEEAQAQIVAGWWPGAGRNTGGAVLARCGGDLGAAWSAVRKAVCAGLPPVPASVDLVCLPGAHGEFADHLVACDTRAAVAAASSVPPEEAGAALSLLSSRLSVLALLGDAARKGENVTEFARRQRIDQFLVRMLARQARVYTPDKVAHCRQLLAMAETHWRAGARDGILEAVAALWLRSRTREHARGARDQEARVTDEVTTDMTLLTLAEETCARIEAEERLAVTWRVAVEAMRLLTREQLIELRCRCDALEVGDSGRVTSTGKRGP